jgi:hypothetical protein
MSVVEMQIQCFSAIGVGRCTRGLMDVFLALMAIER